MRFGNRKILFASTILIFQFVADQALAAPPFKPDSTVSQTLPASCDPASPNAGKGNPLKPPASTQVTCQCGIWWEKNAAPNLGNRKVCSVNSLGWGPSVPADNGPAARTKVPFPPWTGVGGTPWDGKPWTFPANLADLANGNANPLAGQRPTMVCRQNPKGKVQVCNSQFPNSGKNPKPVPTDLNLAQIWAWTDTTGGTTMAQYITACETDCASLTSFQVTPGDIPAGYDRVTSATITSAAACP